MSTRMQREVLEWAVEAFGEIALQKRERALRFLEEALELAQAAGLGTDDVVRMQDRVCWRPPGNLEREFGQAAITLLSLAEVHGVTLGEQAAVEFERVRRIPTEVWRERHAAKRRHGIVDTDEMGGHR